MILIHNFILTVMGTSLSTCVKILNVSLDLVSIGLSKTQPASIFIGKLFIWCLCMRTTKKFSGSNDVHVALLQYRLWYVAEFLTFRPGQ